MKITNSVFRDIDRYAINTNDEGNYKNHIIKNNYFHNNDIGIIIKSPMYITLNIFANMKEAVKVVHKRGTKSIVYVNKFIRN